MPGCTNTHTNMSRSKSSTPMTKPSFRIKATLCCDVIHASMHKKLGEPDVRSCIMPGLPGHLVQELNAGTVHGKNVMIDTIPKLVLLGVSLIVCISIYR